jgi:DNA-binding transcriptional LysR family regulator
MERFTSLTAFHRVVEENGFAAAARSLRISPAMVSKHVHDLEITWGCAFCTGPPAPWQ